MHLLVVTQSLWLITSSMMICPFLVYLKAPFNLCKPVKQVHRKEQCWCKEPGNNVPYYKDGLQDDSSGKWKCSFNNMNGTPFWQMTDISAVLGIRIVIDLEPTSKNPTFLSDVQASHTVESFRSVSRHLNIMLQSRFHLHEKLQAGFM